MRHGRADHRRATGGWRNEPDGHCSGLEQKGIPTARGGAWSATPVGRVLDRLGSIIIAPYSPGGGPLMARGLEELEDCNEGQCQAEAHGDIEA